MKKVLNKITSNSIAFIVTFCIIVFGTFTYIKFLSADQYSSDIQTVYLLLIIDFVLLLLLAFILSYKLVCVFIETRRNKAGAKLQRRLIKIFSIMLTVPVTLICISYVFSSYLGIQVWFSDRVKTAINESVYVSEAYLEEHNNIIKSDILNLGNMIAKVPWSVYNNKNSFNEFLKIQSHRMNLPEIKVFDSSGRIVGSTELSLSSYFDPFSNTKELEEARDGEIVIISNADDDRLFALIQMDGFIETFLLVGKFIDADVLQHVEISKEGAETYFNLEKKIKSIQVTFIMVFAMFAMIVLLVSIWISFFFANKISAPIVSLIKASRKVGEGNLNLKLKEDESSGEINDLIRAFNLMTKKLNEQQKELIEARDFMESVLSGVYSGVIGVNNFFKITIVNKSAENILKINSSKLIGKDITKIIPDTKNMFKNKINNKQIEICPLNGSCKIIAMSIIKQENQNFVISMRDISNLISAQKKAAWGDVARRIAHEIKNPLTPIALSAERMKRKFKDDVSDKEIFNSCIDTILRQVNSLGNMINEFSSFARMPEPVFEETNISNITKNTALSFKENNLKIEFKGFSKSISCHCDKNQIERAITNVIKNAIESMEDKKDKRIKVSLYKKKDLIIINIEDFGAGVDLNKEITEPYITTKKTGTGLGLAIVKKIMEEHNGSISFKNKKNNGAIVSLSFKCMGDKRNEG